MLPIAIVEDNADVLDDLLFNLRRLGFSVTGYPDGVALDAALAAGREWSVLLLDLGLPGEDGLSIARRLRQTHPALGIIALTARGRLIDRVTGLNEGVDLYLVKPIDMTELAASIRAVARRVAQIGETAPLWRLDPRGPHIIRPDGEQLALGLSEFHLLAAMALEPTHSVGRADLMRAMGKDPESYDPRVLEVVLSRLRAKLGEQGPLKAVRGQGYRFAARLSLEPGSAIRDAPVPDRSSP